MTSEGAELDLYADDIGDEFSQENEFNDSDLYDDVITSNSKSRAGGGGGAAGGNSGSNNAADEPSAYNGSSNQSQNSNHSNNLNMLSTHHNSNNDGILRGGDKKPCIYVGNLTWWTTDEDVIKSLSSVGVNDVTEIKFFENRANGQSKGFCVVTLQMESSVRNALEKLPKTELHGQTVAVTMCNRQNLTNFEMKSRKPGQNGPNNNNNNGNNQNYNNQNNTNRGGGGGNFNQNQNMSGVASGRPPLLPGRPGGLSRPNNGPLLNNQPRLPQLPHQTLAPFGANPQQWSQLMQNGPGRNAGLHGSGGPGLNPMLRLPQGNRALANQPLLSAPSNQGDLRTTLSSVGLAGVGQHPLNASHVNALFGSQQSLVPPNAGGDHQFANRFGGMNPFGAAHPGNDAFDRSGLDMGISMGSAEFEEILMKNKNLANNAIQRAVTDAASGDYSTSIDTLATAISLISQSRVSHDERCKIIISSLKDTLQSIESKSYSSGGDRGRKDRPRSRERSRERGSSRREKSRRDRSRSRERDGYRERSRDRHYDDRHYDDRHRKEESGYRDNDRHHRDHRGRH